jgi:hypothetical protein
MPTAPINVVADRHKETLFSIVKEMSESMTGAQSTRHWAEDALWFDIQCRLNTLRCKRRATRYQVDPEVAEALAPLAARRADAAHGLKHRRRT